MKENSVIRLQPVLLLMVILAAALVGILLFAGYETKASYLQMQEASEEYRVCELSARDMEIGSDELTKQAMAYVVTGEKRHMDRYFEEANGTRNREKALRNLGKYFHGTEAYAALENAMERSNELMEEECYSMRLMADGMQVPATDLPEELSAVELTPQDRALSDEEKKDRAREILFGADYDAAKDSVIESINQCVEKLQSEAREWEVSSSEHMAWYLNFSYLLIGALLILIFFTFLLTTLLALRPLRKAIAKIQEKELIPESGSYEVRYLAHTYNTMFEKNRQHQDKLSYEATHDALTGVYNRSVFEDRLPSYEYQQNALILLDVDYFKTMNDTYGHQVGDRVLKKLADALQHSFRGEDYVCRIGGDEFAVMMVNVDPEMKNLVVGKLIQIKQRISAEDGVPPFTLSIGIAFSEEGKSGADIFKNADAALYEVKERGRNGYAFYTLEDKIIYAEES